MKNYVIHNNGAMAKCKHEKKAKQKPNRKSNELTASAEKMLHSLFYSMLGAEARAKRKKKEECSESSTAAEFIQRGQRLIKTRMALIGVAASAFHWISVEDASSRCIGPARRKNKYIQLISLIEHKENGCNGGGGERGSASTKTE